MEVNNLLMLMGSALCSSVCPSIGLNLVKMYMLSYSSTEFVMSEKHISKIGLSNSFCNSVDSILNY